MPETSASEELAPLEALCAEVRGEPFEVRHDVRYADLNGDGMPDAVLTLVRRVVDEHHGVATIDEVITVASQIGVDGRPRSERRYERLLSIPTTDG